VGDTSRIRGANETLVSVGGPIDEVRVSLGVYGDDLDPDMVTAMLGAQPSRCHRKDDLLHPDRGIRARTGAWLLESGPPVQQELEQHISKLLAQVTPDLNTWRQLADLFDLKIWCMLTVLDWNRGCDLSSELLHQLADRRLGLGFDIYADDP
jgi:hypothetical protein